jgi:hypothetical protein
MRALGRVEAGGSLSVGFDEGYAAVFAPEEDLTSAACIGERSRSKRFSAAWEAARPDGALLQL